MSITAMDEVAMGDSVALQGTTAPGKQPPGAVLVAAIIKHKCDGERHLPGTQYYLEKHRAKTAAERGIVHIVGGPALDWWNIPGRELSPWPEDTLKGETVFTRERTTGALKIVQGTGYDAGSQGYRLHTALNQHTKHASIFVRWADSNPYCSLRMLDGERDADLVREAVVTADVIHCHVNYLLLNNTGMMPQPGQRLVRHYHGSIRPDKQQAMGRTWIDPNWDMARGAIMVGARLTLVAEAKEKARDLGFEVPFHWLPIAVDVARYRKLSKERPSSHGTHVHDIRRAGQERPRALPSTAFRIAHCPTDTGNKGTDKFLKVIDRLNAKGLSVVPVLMKNVKLGDALARKATCDATFDSFWLGIQTSGLEAGAMGLPCIAGDHDVARLYREEIGHVPYTFADDERELERVIEQLVTDKAYYASEAKRCEDYVLRMHDYPAVARRYEEILSGVMHRPDVITAIPPAAPKKARKSKVA